MANWRTIWRAMLVAWLGCWGQAVAQNVPSTEVRAVWLTTRYQLDWKLNGLTTEQQKQRIILLLDRLKELNFNTILFQVRSGGTVMYRSQIEPMNPAIRTQNADGSPFDPLVFVTTESHRRGMECHAWMAVYPLGKEGEISARFIKNLNAKYPNIALRHGGTWVLDPGNVATTSYLLGIVGEIVRNYDVDGVHFDYVRYPEEAHSFPDGNTFRRYGQGKNRSQWRTDNVTRFVSESYKLAKSLKPWVQMSSAPLGIYRSIDGRGNRWSGLESVHQDSYGWLASGIQDLVFPMLYADGNNFYPYVTDWQTNASGRTVVAGLGIYKMLPEEGSRSIEKQLSQLDFLRKANASGAAFFRAGMIMSNLKGFADSLAVRYTHPAKLPPMTWLSQQRPEIPTDFQIEEVGDSVRFRWQTSGANQAFILYRFSTDGEINIDVGENVLVAGIRGNSVTLKLPEDEYGFYYGISAIDRYHNESSLSDVAFFVRSRTIRQ